MRQTRRVGSFTSPLARFRRCESLSIRFHKAKGDDDIPHPSLLAGWLVAGVGADVARNISMLSLAGALDLPTLTSVSLVLAGTLRHVHTLQLNTICCGSGGFGNLDPLHSALRGAFPALQELCLPAVACLRGLEAFAGSALHTVRVMRDSPGCLRLSHVRSLLQLSRLRHLDLAGEGWEARWVDDGGDQDAWEDLDTDDEDKDDDAEEGVQAGTDEELALGDATLLKTLRGLDEKWVQELWALRRLLASAPPTLESLRLRGHLDEINFEGGRITRVATSKYYYQPDGLRRAAAALLPRLEATGQRLVLLQVEQVLDAPPGVISLLQPHSAFVRLLAKCDRVELGRLRLDVGSVQLGAETAAAAAAALQAVATAMGGELPDELQVWASDWDWTLQMRPRCQRGGGGDSGAAADGRGGSCGRGTGGAATAAPAAVIELTAEQVLERAADKIHSRSSRAGGQMAAAAVATRFQLYRAAAAAAREAPCGLQVSAARVSQFTDCWRHAIAQAIRELWHDHLSSAPQPAAAASIAAAGAGGPADGGDGAGGGPAKTNAAGAVWEPERAPRRQPAGDAAGGVDGGDNDDLQVLMRLLPLLEQAHAAVMHVKLDNA
ncbi:hypothetical protein HXX76_015137 [Chlamydomonas incerta]|uniref:Uncharacterized protein n=1 Tax=Chlamydomonas incerta TaxID=51695 RepID=A0A835SJP5_CHLIN|nr:hypothetical protein HXX76_015137 [Chlamydomonas incerta]|eukprot:KAG2423619.1 hypothetical protein HXX76_015137 [Chlamydomonas incerta]